MKSGRELRKSLARLKQAVQVLEQQILALEPTTTTLNQLLGEIPSNRTAAMIIRAARSLGCQPEDHDTWTIGPMLDMDEGDWLSIRNCGVVTMHEVLRTLEPFRAKQ